MKTNNAMRLLLDEVSQSSLDSISSDLLNPHFIEWDNCIFIDNTSSANKITIKETTYHDRTEMEASINHYHLDDFLTGFKLISNWKEILREKFPNREFILLLSSSLEGNEVVIRFYQKRIEEPEWVDLNNIEGYKEEALLVIEILNETQ